MKAPKVKKPKVSDDASFGPCPSYHFLASLDRIKKIGTTTWKFVPDKFLGKKAKHIADEGYYIQKHTTIL